MLSKLKCSIGIVLTFAVLSSCCATKPEPVHVTDTVTVEKTITLRDTVLIAPAASTSFNIHLNEVSKGLKQPVISKNGQAKASLKQVGSQLLVECQCDTVAIAAQLRDTSEKREKKQVVTLPPVYIKYCPWYTKVLAWFGGIGLLFLAVFVFLKIYRIV